MEKLQVFKLFGNLFICWMLGSLVGSLAQERFCEKGVQDCKRLKQGYQEPDVGVQENSDGQLLQNKPDDVQDNNDGQLLQNKPDQESENALPNETTEESEDDLQNIEIDEIEYNQRYPRAIDLNSMTMEDIKKRFEQPPEDHSKKYGCSRGYRQGIGYANWPPRNEYNNLYIKVNDPAPLQDQPTEKTKDPLQNLLKWYPYDIDWSSMTKEDIMIFLQNPPDKREMHNYMSGYGKSLLDNEDIEA